MGRSLGVWVGSAAAMPHSSLQLVDELAILTSRLGIGSMSSISASWELDPSLVVMARSTMYSVVVDDRIRYPICRDQAIQRCAMFTTRISTDYFTKHKGRPMFNYHDRQNSIIYVTTWVFVFGCLCCIHSNFGLMIIDGTFASRR